MGLWRPAEGGAPILHTTTAPGRNAIRPCRCRYPSRFSTFTDDHDLVIRNLATRKDQRTGTTRGGSPSFSHDGRWLVHVYAGESGGTELWLLSVDSRPEG